MHTPDRSLEHARPVTGAATGGEFSVPPSGVSYRVLLGLAPLIDVIGVLLIAGAVYLVYSDANPETFRLYLGASVMYAILLVAGFEVRGLYEYETLKPPASEAAKIIFMSIAGFGVLLVCGYVLKITDEFSRVWGMSTVIGTVGFLILRRAVFHRYMLRLADRGLTTRRVVVVGSGEQARRFLDHLNPDCEPWLKVVGVFEDDPGSDQVSLNGYPVLGTVDDLVHLVRAYGIDEVIVALPWSSEARIKRVVDRLSELPVAVHLGADLAGYLFPKQRFVEMGQVPVLRVQQKPLDGWGSILKAVEDRMLAALLMLLFGPLMLAIAAAIKLESKGPIIFQQPRYGFNNRVFQVFKFRTMYHDRSDIEHVPQATKEDPRVTRVGRLLRKTSLDELPQLFNVLNGSMSLVGPRPHAVVHNEEYAKLIDGYFARHRVKPGITGWAQVNGFRGETDSTSKMADRVRYDVFYIENWSIMLDVQILVRTAFVGFIHPNAY